MTHKHQKYDDNGRPDKLQQLQTKLKLCRLCPDMAGVPVHGKAVYSPVMLIGQAPGIKEAERNRPFAWTAGKTLFKWFASIGVEEQHFRQHIYMTAVCRCFPGKAKKTGDRLPNMQEINRCRQWLSQEIAIIRPRLIIPVGKLAINQIITIQRLQDIVGQQFRARFCQHTCDFVPLPHPSGASTWFRTEPGKGLLEQALQQIAQHEAWQAAVNGG